MKTVIVVMMIAFTNVSLAQTEAGQRIFEKNCKKCHGSDGKRGLFGAKDLSKSKLSVDQAKKMISNGKGIMPAWKEKLDEHQIETVIGYILTLRQ